MLPTLPWIKMLSTIHFLMTLTLTLQSTLPVFRETKLVKGINIFTTLTNIMKL